MREDLKYLPLNENVALDKHQPLERMHKVDEIRYSHGHPKDLSYMEHLVMQGFTLLLFFHQISNDGMLARNSWDMPH